jgi:hypothetical protein
MFFDPTTLEINAWVYIPPAFAGDTSELLNSLGPSLSSCAGGTKCQDLIPYTKFAAPRNSMSAVIGTGAQPMHTDQAHSPSPPRYVVLKCIEPGEGRCPTHLWIPKLDQFARDRSSILTTVQWVFDDRRSSPFYSSILESLKEGRRIRFDPCCMRPSSFCRDRVEDASDLLKRQSRWVAVEWEMDAVLVFDNWRCLHARAAGSARAPSRRLRRWYIGDRNGLG